MVRKPHPLCAAAQKCEAQDVDGLQVQGPWQGVQPPADLRFQLQKVKQDAEAHLGETVEEVVITCPASHQRR